MMRSPILSLPYPEQITPLEWIERLRAFANQWFPECDPFCVELPAMREGTSGPFPDYTEIDRIETLVDSIENAQGKIASLLLPVNLNISAEQFGEQVSTINGWSDIASYSAIDLIRLFPDHGISPNLNALQEILEYIQDLEIRCSLIEPSPEIIQWLSSSFVPQASAQLGIHGAPSHPGDAPLPLQSISIIAPSGAAREELNHKIQSVHSDHDENCDLIVEIQN